MTAEQQHVVIMGEYNEHQKRDLVFSHVSAAAALGIPHLGGPGTRPHELRLRVKGGGHVRSGAQVHTTKSMPDVVQVNGLWVTSPARTVIDLSSSQGFASGLIAADHVLRAELATLDELQAEMETARKGWAWRTADAVVARADGLSESPGESLSRARLYQLGAPASRLQVKFFDHEGFVGRADGYMEEQDCIWEFDGRSKYGRANDLQLSPEDQLWHEKTREDRLRMMVKKFLRWTWIEAFKALPLETKLRKAEILTGPKQRLFGLRA
ncbi:MAG: hypothetical protein Q4G64_01795 [bacterium]|nr:hypothetical protein [bacterium]